MSEFNMGENRANDGGIRVTNDAFESGRNLVVHADEAAFVKSTSVGEVFSALKALSEMFRSHLDQAIADMKDQSKRDAEAMLAIMHQESAKRTAMEHRLHSQLLLQNEYMVALELKLLRLEAKVERREATVRQRQQNLHQQPRTFSSNRLPSSFTTINESALEMPSASHQNDNGSSEEEATPPNMAVISSGASLASGVTAGSFLGDDGDDQDEDEENEGGDDDQSENRSGTVDSGNPVSVDEDDRQASEESRTPPRVVGENGRSLESILLNPMIGETNVLEELSVRATRGRGITVDDTDESTIQTLATNATFASTVATMTTRGDGSTINVRRVLPEEQSEVDIHTPARRGRPTLADDAMNSREEPRSRSQSPLTVATHASETLSMASASTVGTSIRSSVAVAPRGGFGRRTIPFNAYAGPIESRPLPDRVVSFTPDLTSLPAPPHNSADSITMPDELDNFSEVADNFASTAGAWREEYEARLDALHKRWTNE